MNNQVENDLLNARQNKDTIALGVLRLIKANIENDAIAKQGDLNDEEIMAIIRKERRQSVDALEAGRKAGRQDIVEKYTKVVELLDRYLPKQLTEDEIKNLLLALGAQKGDNQGKLIGLVMKDHRALVQADVVKKVIADNFA